MTALISEQQQIDVSTILSLALGATTRAGLGKPARSPGQEWILPQVTTHPSCPQQ